MSFDISSDRFALSPSDRAGIEAWTEHIWHNAEVCNHCFTKIREIEHVKRRVGKNQQKSVQWEIHERTENATNEHTPWDDDTHGTTFCLRCGRDTRATHGDMGIDDLTPLLVNLDEFVTAHTALYIDGEQLVRELVPLLRRRDTQGRETQCISVAFARSLRPDQQVFTDTSTSTPPTAD